MELHDKGHAGTNDAFFAVAVRRSNQCCCVRNAILELFT